MNSTSTWFEIVSKIDEGGEAYVFRCREWPSGRHVAAKIPKAPWNVGDRVRFLEEVERLRRFHGPGVIDVVGFERRHGWPMVFLEYAPNGSLRDELRRRGMFNPLEALHVVRDIARALGALHLDRTVHRDVKPSNILFDANWNPKVADFGMATLARPETRLRPTFGGTPDYMAPEQRNGYPRTESDIFSLGRVLREMVTGSPVVRNDVPSPREQWPQLVGPRLPALLDTFTAREPSERPSEGHKAARILDLLIDVLEKRVVGRTTGSRPRR